MNKKKLVWSMILFIILSVVFYNLVYKKYIDPEYEIEEFLSEKGKYLYIVKEYGKYPDERHSIEKINMKNDNVIWRKKIERKYHLNHHAGGKKPALFFDENNIYYSIEDMHRKFYLLGFKKNNGESLLNIDIKKVSGIENLDSLLLPPYLNLQNKILVLKHIMDKKNKFDILFTAIDKKDFKISNYKIPLKISTFRYPQGIKNENNSFFSLQNHNYSYFFNKNDISDCLRIKTNSYYNLLRNNNFYYFNHNDEFVKIDLENQKKKKLFRKKDLKTSYSQFFYKDNFIVLDYKRLKRIPCYDFNGNLKWEYKFPEGYYYQGVFALDQLKYNPEESIYYEIRYDYFPILINKPSEKDDGISNKKLIMLNLKDGKAKWIENIKNIRSIYLLPSDIYGENEYYYIFFKNDFIKIDAKTGKVIKKIILKYKYEDKTYNILGRHDLKIYNFSNNYLYTKFGDSVLRVNLINGEYDYYGKIKSGIEFIIKNSETAF